MSSLDEDNLTDAQIEASINMAIDAIHRFVSNTEQRDIKQYVLNDLDNIASDSE